MDLLEDFDRARGGAAGAERGSSDSGDFLLVEGLGGGGGASGGGGYGDLPSLSVELTARQAARCGASIQRVKYQHFKAYFAASSF